MISIIVPVYKVEPYLRQCVDSILHQTYRNIEVLLIDDGSPDKCGEICDEYTENDKRVRAFHTENRGLSAARNLGVCEAKGEYIGFVDSDDWIEPDMYERLLRRIEDTGADISVCGLWTEYLSSAVMSQFKETVYSKHDALIALIEGKISNCVWNKLYHRNLYGEIEFQNGKNFEDISIMHRIIAVAERIAVVDYHGYHYRQRIDSITLTYTASNLLDYADANLSRYCYFEQFMKSLFIQEHEKLLLQTAIGISRVWRWWYGCSREERKLFKGQINEMVSFSRKHYPLFGFRNWPKPLRVASPFIHSNTEFSFGILYVMNRIFRFYATKENSNQAFIY